MLTEADIEEALSRAYVYAVASRAGINLAGSIKDYGTDGTFREVEVFEGKRYESGWSLDFQLKASKNCRLESDSLVYDLEADAYNKLARRRDNAAVPIILIVMALPQRSDEWLVLTEEQLLLRHCCYWWSVDGSLSENIRSVRIRIPRAQRLTPENLSELLSKVKDGSLV